MCKGGGSTDKKYFYFLCAVAFDVSTNSTFNYTIINLHFTKVPSINIVPCDAPILF